MGPLESITNFRVFDSRLACAGQPTLAQLSAVAAAGYECVISLLPDSSSHAVAGEGDHVRGLGMEFVHLPVDWDDPKASDLEAFCAAMDARSEKRIFVHCAMNMRVSAFLYLWQCRRGGEDRHAKALMESVWDPAEYPVWDALLARETGRN